MEWMVVNPLQIHSTFSSLGVQVGNSYIVNEDCLATLDEILSKLSIEDRTLRTFRRALGFSQVIKKDLIPLLINIKDDFKIIDATVRILVSLTIPVECLLPVDVMSKTDVGQHTIFEVNKLLLSGKEAFLDIRSTRAVLDHVRRVLEKDELSVEESDSINNCLLLLRNVLHIPEGRNHSGNAPHCSMQNQILWNLFAQSMDKVLIHLMTCQQKGCWGVTMVQLIALMYKDQHVGTLQKLLNTWFEASLSESSEDNESNTSPPEQGSGDSSPMLTSDPTSDSSDTGSSQTGNRMVTHCTNKMDTDYKGVGTGDGMPGKQHVGRVSSHAETSKQIGKGSSDMQRKGINSRKGVQTKGAVKERLSDGDSGVSSHYSQISGAHTHHHSHKRNFLSNSELSDCGYATQMENQEQISTSSNEDEGPHMKRPIHQKPHNMHQKTRYPSKTSGPVDKSWRRKKLVKRSKTTLMNMKVLLHHTPTDEDISNLLKEFTVDFLLKGYGSLVQELYNQLLNSSQQIQMDTSHFFWLVTYFLKFAAQLELDLEHVSTVLSFEIVSYLTYEGVNLCEQLELAVQQPGSDLKQCLRRMHLVVTAIREFIQAVDTYKKISHLSVEDKLHIHHLQVQIGSTEDLKFLFVLLLRSYNSSLQNKQYLQDLIVTNHILLLFLDSVSKLPEYKGSTNIMDHIKQFATVEVMYQYGLLLEDFQNNGEFINDCLFTMMHHIGGDVEQTTALFQPVILKTFLQIWETDFEICDDWSDLIEYVIHKFVNTPSQNPLSQQKSTVQAEPIIPVNSSGWTQDDLDNLYWYYVQSAKSTDPVGQLVELFVENGVTNKTRLEVIQQLLTQDVITHNQYDDFMKHETVKPTKLTDKLKLESHIAQKKIITFQQNVGLISATQDCEISDKINMLRDVLLKEEKGDVILWLQKLLIECCYVKLYTDSNNSLQPPFPMEPVAHHFTLLKQSIPIVAWNSSQRNILSYKPFILLLHKLGFHLPADSGKVFARIPHFWTADVMFEVAKKLGPIDTASLKFDANLLSCCDKHETIIDTPPPDIGTNSSNVFAVPRSKQTSSMIRFTPLPNPMPNWLQIVGKSKEAVAPPLLSLGSPPQMEAQSCILASESACSGHEMDRMVTDADSPVVSAADIGDLPVDDQHSVCSVCETGAGSVASDLTRMCVSDEDDRDLSDLSKKCMDVL